MNDKKFGLGVFLYVFSQDLTKVLLLKLNEIKRKKFNATWGNVGGKINLGETSLDACVREAEEEIGIQPDIKETKLLYVREIPNFFNGIHAVQFVYGTTIKEQAPIRLGEELESYQWFELNNLPDGTLYPREDFYKACHKFLSNSS